jgi:hypothetical protein
VRLLLFFLVVAVLSQAAHAAEFIARIEVDVANVRSGPGAEFKVQDSLKRGAAVLVTGRAVRPGWVPVTYFASPATEPRQGFMATSTLRAELETVSHDETRDRTFRPHEFVIQAEATSFQCERDYAGRLACKVGVSAVSQGPEEFRGAIDADCTVAVEFKKSESDYLGSSAHKSDYFPMPFDRGSGYGTTRITVNEPVAGLEKFAYAKLKSIRCLVMRVNSR